MAGSDAPEGQAVWQPGGAEEDSRLREGNRHLHLAYDEEEEDLSEHTCPRDTLACCWDVKLPTNQQHQSSSTLVVWWGSVNLESGRQGITPCCTGQVTPVT